MRIFQQEQRLVDERSRCSGADAAAESILAQFRRSRAALHAYVAEGQVPRLLDDARAMLLEKLRTSLLELEPPASAAGASLTESLDLTDRLAASDERARDHVSAGQRLLAGEIVFTEARDVLDAMRQRLGAPGRRLPRLRKRPKARFGGS